MAWGVIEHDHGEFMDVVPGVRVLGEWFRDEHHISGMNCECMPHMITNRHGYKMLIHNDPNADDKPEVQ